MHQISSFLSISLSQYGLNQYFRHMYFKLFTLNFDLHTARYLSVVVIMVVGSDKHQETIYQANLSPYLYQYQSTHCSSFTVFEIIWYLQCCVFARCMLIKQEEI